MRGGQAHWVRIFHICKLPSLLATMILFKYVAGCIIWVATKPASNWICVWNSEWPPCQCVENKRWHQCIPSFEVSHINKRPPSSVKASSCDPNTRIDAMWVPSGLFNRDIYTEKGMLKLRTNPLSRRLRSTSLPRTYFSTRGPAAAQTASPSMAMADIGSAVSGPNIRLCLTFHRHFYTSKLHVLTNKQQSHLPTFP